MLVNTVTEICRIVALGPGADIRLESRVNSRVASQIRLGSKCQETLVTGKKSSFIVLEQMASEIGFVVEKHRTASKVADILERDSFGMTHRQSETLRLRESRTPGVRRTVSDRHGRFMFSLNFGWGLTGGRRKGRRGRRAIELSIKSAAVGNWLINVEIT